MRFQTLLLFSLISGCNAFIHSTWRAPIHSSPVHFQPKPKSLCAPRMKVFHAQERKLESSSVPTTQPSFDIGKYSQFALWYLGNYYYNIANKMALKAAGGASGFPMTVSCLQLGVGVVYALFLWMAPDARSKPNLTTTDVIKLVPLGIYAAGAHAGSVFAAGAGAVSFAQIVKSSEPAFSAIIGSLFYSAKMPLIRWLTLIPVIGGVTLASVNELDFSWCSLISAGIANTFASFKGHENKKLMNPSSSSSLSSKDNIQTRLGSIGNQFAVTSIIAFLTLVPLSILMEGAKYKDFLLLLQTSSVLRNNLILSGLYFYGYNELATMTMKTTNAVTNSVANTAKRVIVILGIAAVMGESLDPMKLVGCSIAIAGVFFYSLMPSFLKKKTG